MRLIVSSIVEDVSEQNSIVNSVRVDDSMAEAKWAIIATSSMLINICYYSNSI